MKENLKEHIENIKFWVGRNFTVKEIPSKSDEHEETGIFVMNKENNDHLALFIDPDTDTLEVKVNGDWNEILDEADFWREFYWSNKRKL